MDYDKLNKVVTQIAADTQMYFHCLSKLKCSLVPVLQLLIWQMPFSPSPSIRPTRSSLPSLVSLRGTSALQPYHDLVGLDCLSFLQAVILVHYIDDMELIGPSE